MACIQYIVCSACLCEENRCVRRSNLYNVFIMKWNPSIFKAYDIRGRSPGDFDADFAGKLGCAVAQFTNAKIVVIGRDMRTTTPELADSLISSIRSMGVNVIDVGLATTPMFYLAVAQTKGADAGIMITASHNPVVYNGFKMVRGDAMPIGGSEIQELRKLVEKNESLQQKVEIKEGTLETRNVHAAYLEKLWSLLSPERIKNLSIVVDGGNGMAGVILPELFAKLSVKVEKLFWEPDGTFPNHPANPLEVETLKTLQKRVVETGAALGVAYDGDADRLGVVDEKGNVVPAHFIAALLTPDIARCEPGAPMLYDLRMSNVYRDAIIASGARAIMTRVGHAFIKKDLRAHGALFAAELSGHYYFKDFFGVECTDLVLLMLLQKLSETGKPFSELIASLSDYFHSGEINFTVPDAPSVLAKLRERYRSLGLVTDIDGLRVDFGDWWFSVRASNTEPLVRLNVEAKTCALMEERRNEITDIITNSK